MTPSAPGAVVSTPTSSALRHLRASPSLIVARCSGRVVVDPDPVLAQAAFRVGQRRVDQPPQVHRAQRFEQKHLRAADQRPVDREERIFRRRAEQPDGAALHVGQQGVLLRAVEAVNLVDEQDGPRRWVETLAVLGGGDHPADVRDGALDAVEPLELRLGDVRDDLREAGLARARRAVEQRGIQPVRLDGAAQEFARREQMLLPGVLVERARAHPRGQRRAGVHGGGLRGFGRSEKIVGFHDGG